MKKKILLLVAALMIFATGVISASSLNGDYKGNPIVNVFVNGKKVVSEVPAMIIDGTTMIPLRAVSEAMGGVVGWDPKTYTVNVLTSDPYSTTPTPATKPAEQQKVKGPLSLYSNDGKTYLGKLTANEFDSDSIYNEFGTYGSKFSTNSIWNEFGTYGSKFSTYSAMNDLATKPPLILDGNGDVVGYLTTNTNIKGGVSPVGLKEFLKNEGY